MSWAFELLFSSLIEIAFPVIEDFLVSYRTIRTDFWYFQYLQ